MKLYRLNLEDYGLDSFQVPITCGGTRFLLGFSWDTVAQQHYDDIQLTLLTLRANNALVQTTDTKTIVPNEDFIAYIDSLKLLLQAYNSYSSKWEGQLLYNPSTLDWAAFGAETQIQIEEFLNQYISFNHFSKLQNFQVNLAAISTAITGQDVNSALSLLQSSPSELPEYVNSYDIMLNDIREQLADAEELLYWMVTVSYGDESSTAALEIGAPLFPQNKDFNMWFECDYTHIKRDDLTSVTLYIGVNDGT